MRSRGPLVLAAFVVLAGALLLFRPFLQKEREVVTSTPGPPAIEPSVVALEPGSEACLEGVTFEPRSEIARLGVVPAAAAPELAITARGEGWSSRARVPAGKRADSVEVALDPPRGALVGAFCIRNAGDVRQDLAARGEGRATARPTLKVNGQEVLADVVLTLRRRSPAPVGSRVGEVVDHAAALNPLQPWLVWFLLGAFVLGVPAGALLALRAGSAAPDEPVAPPVRPAPAPPRVPGTARARAAAAAAARRARRVPAWAWLAGLVLAAAVWLWVWASRVGTWQNDEEEYVYLARWITDGLPERLWDFTFLARGLQRLEIFILALPLGTLPAPDAFLAAHAINVAIYASAAIPAWLVARGLGLGTRWRLLAAVLVLATPWVVYSTSFLTEPPGYGIWTWTVWAVWRACLRPGAGSDLLAFALVFLAALTRSGFLLLAPLLPLAVAARALRFGGAREAWRRNPVVTVVGGAGALALLGWIAGALPVGDLAGNYGKGLNFGLGGFLDKVAIYSGRLAVGTGFVVFAVGLAWLLSRLRGRRGEAEWVFAVVALLAAALLFVANVPAGADERYVIYVAPLLAVATAAAFAQRAVGPVAVGLCGVLAAWLVWRLGWNAEGGPYGFFIGPAETFYARVGLLRLETYLPAWLPVKTAALVLALALTSACAYALSARRRAGTVAAALIAGLVVVQIAQAEYTMRKFANDAGARFGPSLEQRAWVDEAIHGEGRAAVFATSLGNTLGFEAVWRELQFWNTSVSDVALDGARAIRTPIGDAVYEIEVDRATGALRGPLPGHVVVPRNFLAVMPVGDTVARVDYLPLDLLRLHTPAQARYTIGGVQPDGFIDSGAEASVRFFTAGLDPGVRWCARFPLHLPGDFSGRRGGGTRWRVRLGRRVEEGRLRPEEARDVDVPLPPGTPARDGSVHAEGRVRLADGRTVALQIGQVHVVRCEGG